MKKFLLLFCVVFAIACNKDDEMEFDAQNEADIQAYISANNLNPQQTITGLYYIIDDEGSGAFPSINSTVTVAYRGYFLNGITFDQAANATFPVAGVIPGFAEAVQLLKPGGSGTFILPSRLGYGNTGTSSIPGGSVIVFDIELISFE